MATDYHTYRRTAPNELISEERATLRLLVGGGSKPSVQLSMPHVGGWSSPMSIVEAMNLVVREEGIFRDKSPTVDVIDFKGKWPAAWPALT